MSIMSVFFLTAALAYGQNADQNLLGFAPVTRVPSVSDDTVHIRGVAYQFLKSRKIRLEGATIKVVEFPQIETLAGKNGYYDLIVPAHAQVTPYIAMKGYHTTYLQTFTTDGQDLNNVHFEIPKTIPEHEF